MHFEFIFVIIKLFLLLVVFDFVYFYFTYSIYANNVARIQRVAMQINIPVAIICYVLIALGYYYFLLRKKDTSLVDAVFLGGFVYGVYNLTSWALFKKYDWFVAVMDTLWGSFLFGLVFYVLQNILLM
jgi:uncharacterized membrane protein